MTALLAAVFVASIVGSLHCAGMCGGIVALSVAGRPVSRARDVLTLLPYHFGRLVSYALLGTASGALGAAIDLGGSGAGLGRIAALVAGITMILIGLVALLRARGVRFGCGSPPRFLRSTFQRGFAWARSAPPATRGLTLGLLTAALPCGWLYAFVISAAATGSPWRGALVMTAFWLGTVPILLGVGVGLQAITVPLRRHVPTVAAVALVVIGAIAILGRLDVPAYAAEFAPVTTTEADDIAGNVRDLDSSRMPCCDGP